MSDPINIDETESVMDFPCDIDVKIFIKNNDEYQDVVRQLIERKLQKNQLKSWTVRDSSGAKYIAITAVVYAHSRDQIDDLYRLLGAHEYVIMMI